MARCELGMNGNNDIIKDTFPAATMNIVNALSVVNAQWNVPMV